MDLEPTLLQEHSADDAESLTSRLDPDTMANEQTWPTDEEMNGNISGSAVDAGSRIPDAKVGTTPKRVKMVPRGTSAYQAAWIVDDEDGEEDEEFSDTDGEDVSMKNEGDEESTRGQEEEDLVELTADDMEADSRRGKDEFEDLDMEEDEKQYAGSVQPVDYATNLRYPETCRLDERQGTGQGRIYRPAVPR